LAAGAIHVSSMYHFHRWLGVLFKTPSGKFFHFFRPSRALRFSWARLCPEDHHAEAYPRYPPLSPYGGFSGSSEPFGIEERLYSAREVASRLGVSERWIRDHATRRNPRIRAIKLGPLVRFRWPDVQAFLAEMTAKNDSKHR
jgi:excisionase family DNA binding protein